MEQETHELIHYDAEFPFRFYINQLTGYESKHWHSSLEILFVLSGQLHVTVDDVDFTLQEEDIIVLNEDSIHSLQSETCEMILLQMDLERICYDYHHTNYYYQCCSCHRKNSDRDFHYIRYLLARIIQTNSETFQGYQTMAFLYSLLNELNTSFAEIRFNASGSDKHSQRIRQITHYMKRHYRENLTLTTLAEHQNLSVSYLSKFFEKHMGSNFVQYYTSLRLERAVNEILTSDNTIENISQNSGFSDSRSLVKAFKKNYGMLPSSYRKSFAKNNTKASAPLLIPAKWTSIQLNDTGKLEQLRKYLNLFPSELPVSKHNLKYIDCETIDYRSGISVLHHNYRSMITVSSAKLLLHSSVRDMIRDAQQEIGFQYISFHGLLSDDMMVYNESLDGNPSISFTYINEVLDFVTSLHLKPFIRLNFMPSSLASSTDKCIYFRKDIISKPKEIGKWQLLVEKLFKNLIHRYGVKEVSSWPVNIWNEPATSIFGFDDETDFFQFYVTTFRMIKNILPSAKIGTPPITFLDDSWFIRFHQFLLKNQCYPDYIDLHYYDDAAATSKKIDESTDKSFFFQNLSHFGIIDSLNTDPDSFFLYLNDFKKTMKNIGYSKIPHYLSEWNLTLSSRNRINDTCFKACYLAKNLLENYDRLDSFGYWSITDHHEEQQIPSSLYHGGFGLLTMNGIPKASYNVLRLMKRLGNTFLGRGSGWFATKEDYKVMVLYYNYEHYPKLFSSGKLFDMTNIENFVPFSNKQDCVAKVHFTNLPAKNCKVKEYFVNRNHGSSFDTWIRMGGESLNQEDLEFLRNTSSEGLYVHKEEIIGGHLTISSILEPLEIRLVEIELMDYM